MSCCELPQFIKDLEWDSAPIVSDMPDDDRPEQGCRQAPAGYKEAWEGLGSPECPGYVPTRHELMQIAAYWLTEFLFIETICFFGEPVDGRDGASQRLALDRLDCLAEVLDKEARDWVVAEVETDFRERVGDSEWERFKVRGKPDEEAEEVDRIVRSNPASSAS